MNYNFDNLDAYNFETLVQSLSKKIIGAGVKIYGAGPDGQREASFEGEAHYPSEKNGWSGYWIIQAKYKAAATKENDFSWLKKCFEKEMKGFSEKKSAGKKIPDNYLFFTNVTLTPVAERGVKDRIEAVADNYRSLIPNIHILGKDDLSRFLDGARDVASAYSSFILSGDVLQYIYDEVKNKERRTHDAFMRYIAVSFDSDSCSRMEQAGKVDEDKVSLDKVAVDLKFTVAGTDKCGRFIKESIKTGNGMRRFSSSGAAFCKGRLLGNRDSASDNNKFVLKGGAGQGKSTICQYLAQIYRASFINNFTENKDLVPKNITDFIGSLKQDEIPTCYRVPVRIELRLYSSWLSQNKAAGRRYDIVSYIASDISDKAATDGFDNDTLRTYFKKYSWAFFFDGLDEVPESSNRKEVMQEINKFINTELRQADADAVIFATTRPEGYVGEFDEKEFTSLILNRLDEEVCFEYLDKLLDAIEVSPEKKREYRAILVRAWKNPQLNALMLTPLQVTIIAILVREGGEPPRDKYSLFSQYFGIIIKREKQKGIDTILNKNQRIVERTYFSLGFYLQKRSATREASDALINADGLKNLIKEELEGDGIKPDSPEFIKMSDDIYNMVVYRINFATEIKQGYIGFPIRTMQEFLAAVYLSDNTDEKIKSLFIRLAKSAYWMNTFIFLVEHFISERTYLLDTLVDTVVSCLNGDSDSCGAEIPEKEIYYGAQVAFALLSSNVFSNIPKYENRLCKQFYKYAALRPVQEMGNVKSMSQNARREIAKMLVQKGDELTDAECYFAGSLMFDAECAEILEDLAGKNCARIAKQALGYSGEIIPNGLYPIIIKAFEAGEVLSLSVPQIGDILDKTSEPFPESAKRALLMTVFRAATNPRRSDSQIDNRISKLFCCDLKFISDFIRVYRGFLKIDEIDCKVGIPDVPQEKLAGIISLCKKYGLNGMSLVLETLNSRDVSAYKAFADKVSEYKEEIDAAKGYVFVFKNVLMNYIWDAKVGGENYDVDKILGDGLEARLKKIDCIKSFRDVVEELKHEYPLVGVRYSMAIRSTREHDVDGLYAAVKAVVPEKEIYGYPNICAMLLIYTERYITQWEMTHQIAETTAELFPTREARAKFIKLIKSAKTLPDNIGWYLLFSVLPEDEYAELSDVKFEARGMWQFVRTDLFNDDGEADAEADRIMKFIEKTGNVSAFELLYDLIEAGLNVESFADLGKRKIAEFGDQRAACLSALACAKTERDIRDDLLPLLCSDELKEFLYRVISELKTTDVYMPLYVCLLKHFREKNATLMIGMCERMIKNALMSKPVFTE